MTEIDEALHHLGQAFVAGLREPGYQLTTVHPHGHQSQTYTMAGEPALLGRWNNLDLNNAMAALPRVAGRGLVVEMIGDPDGTYTIHWSRDVPSLPARIVLDERYRLPGHEVPPAREPGTTDPGVTDPAVLARSSDWSASSSHGIIRRDTHPGTRRRRSGPPNSTSGCGCRTICAPSTG